MKQLRADLANANLARDKMKREVEEANKILIDKKEEMDRVSKVWHGQGLDEERGGGGQQDPHRQEGRDVQGIQSMAWTGTR
jgi:hypothetical protein